MLPILLSPPHPPKYKVGDRVRFTYTYDDRLDPERHGKEFTDFGIIFGITWGRPHEFDSTRKRDRRWFYLVWANESTLPGFIPTDNFLDTYEEDSLELL